MEKTLIFGGILMTLAFNYVNADDNNTNQTITFQFKKKVSFLGWANDHFGTGPFWRTPSSGDRYQCDLPQLDKDGKATFPIGGYKYCDSQINFQEGDVIY